MKFYFLYAKVPTCLLLFYVKTTTNILRNRMNFKDILVRCQTETNLVSRSLGQHFVSSADLVFASVGKLEEPQATAHS